MICTASGRELIPELHNYVPRTKKFYLAIIVREKPVSFPVTGSQEREYIADMLWFPVELVEMFHTLVPPDPTIPGETGVGI